MEPQTSELMEVALSKSDQAISMISESELSDYAILVEDSGLFIDSLNGFPVCLFFVCVQNNWTQWNSKDYE